MKISIITVVFNGRKTIEDAIRSVASQTYRDIEHIVIDGGSIDGTVEILERYRDKLAKVTCEPDQGIYDAMNKGIRLATGDLIGLLNADDVYADATVLQTVAETFADPAVDACYADLVYVDPNCLSRVVRYWKSQPFRPGLFRQGWVPPHPTFFARKRVYDRYGYFDLRYHLAADFELMLRLLEKHRLNAVYVPKILVKMRLGGATNRSLASIYKQNVEILRAGRQHGVHIRFVPFAARKLFGKSLQFIFKPGNAV